MNYLKIYNKIIEQAKSEDRIKSSNVYYESHHVKPKCLGGSDGSFNLVLLTAREHFICHKLLYKAYPKNESLFRAYHMMSKCENKNHLRQLRISSKEFAIIRETFANIARKKMLTNNPMKDPLISRKCGNTIKKRGTSKGQNNHFYGQDVNGKNNPFYGKKHNKETKERISKSIREAINKNPNMVSKSEDHIRKVSEKTATRYYIMKINIFSSVLGDDELAKYFSVSKETIRERIGQPKSKKEPNIEEMYSDPHRYRNHVRIYEDLKKLSEK